MSSVSLSLAARASKFYFIKRMQTIDAQRTTAIAIYHFGKRNETKQKIELYSGGCSTNDGGGGGGSDGTVNVVTFTLFLTFASHTSLLVESAPYINAHTHS